MNSGRITLAYQDIEESRVDRSFGSLTRNTQKEKVSLWSLNGDFEFDYSEKQSFSYGFEATFNDVTSFASKYDLELRQNEITGFTPSLPIPTRYPSKGST